MSVFLIGCDSGLIFKCWSFRLSYSDYKVTACNNRFLVDMSKRVVGEDIVVDEL